MARLLQFGDSTFPIGGFSFSCGLESAIQTKVVRCVETLSEFTLTMVDQAARGDGVALVWAHRAALAKMSNSSAMSIVKSRRARYRRKRA